jgi:hypothetical protein
MRYMQDSRRSRASTTGLVQEDREDSVDGGISSWPGSGTSRVQQAKTHCRRRVTIPGLRLSPLPRDKKLLFISKEQNPSRHRTMEHDINCEQSRVPVSYCSIPAGLGGLQGPRSSCGGTCVVWSEDGMGRGMGCINFETALRIHFRKD